MTIDLHKGITGVLLQDPAVRKLADAANNDGKDSVSDYLYQRLLTEARSQGPYYAFLHTPEPPKELVAKCAESVRQTIAANYVLDSQLDKRNPHYALERLAKSCTRYVVRDEEKTGERTKFLRELCTAVTDNGTVYTSLAARLGNTLIELPWEEVLGRLMVENVTISEEQEINAFDLVVQEVKTGEPQRQRYVEEKKKSQDAIRRSSLLRTQHQEPYQAHFRVGMDSKSDGELYLLTEERSFVETIKALLHREWFIEGDFDHPTGQRAVSTLTNYNQVFMSVYRGADPLQRQLQGTILLEAKGPTLYYLDEIGLLDLGVQGNPGKQTGLFPTPLRKELLGCVNEFARLHGFTPIAEFDPDKYIDRREHPEKYNDR